MTEASIPFVYTDPGGDGHHGVFHMVRLAAALLDRKLVVVQPWYPIATNKLGGIFPPRKRSRWSDLDASIGYVISISLSPSHPAAPRCYFFSHSLPGARVASG
jgi:hypothetical protein